MSRATGRRSTTRRPRLGLEGVVSKRADGALPERPHQDLDQDQGAADRRLRHRRLHRRRRRPRGSAALALGEWVDGELHYRGKVGTGFDAGDAGRAAGAAASRCAAGATALDGVRRRICIWVRPVLSARIHYANRTADNALRHAVFKGLREVELSTPVAAERKRLISEADLATHLGDQPDAAAVRQVRADQARHRGLLRGWSATSCCRTSLGRPVSLVRCPTGRPQDCFFQRHAFTGMPPSVGDASRPTNSEGETKTYLSVEDAKGYLALAQFGVVEFHAWGCACASSSTSPTAIVFDLDPGRGHRLARGGRGGGAHRGRAGGAGAGAVRQDVGRQGHPRRRADDAEAGLEEGACGDRRDRRRASPRRRPRPSPPTMGKDNRKRRIFIDFHRNARSATAAAPYSLRARTNLPASRR